MLLGILPCAGWPPLPGDYPAPNVSGVAFERLCCKWTRITWRMGHLRCARAPGLPLASLLQQLAPGGSNCAVSPLSTWLWRQTKPLVSQHMCGGLFSFLLVMVRNLKGIPAPSHITTCPLEGWQASGLPQMERRLWLWNHLRSHHPTDLSHFLSIGALWLRASTPKLKTTARRPSPRASGLADPHTWPWFLRGLFIH